MAKRPTTTMLSAAINEYLESALSEMGEKDSRAAYDLDRLVLGSLLRIVGDRQCGPMTPDHFWGFFYGPGGVYHRDGHEVASNRVKPDKKGRRMMPRVSDSTYNSYRSRVMLFVAWGQAKGYFRPGIVFDTFDKKRGRVKPKKVVRPPRQQPAPATMLAMLDTTTNLRDRAYLAVAIETALRASEITPLQCWQVNLDDGLLVDVYIRKTKQYDTMPFHPATGQVLRDWLDLYEEDLGRPLRPEDHLFPSRTHGLFAGWGFDDEGNRVRLRTAYTWVPDLPIRRAEGIVQRALAALDLPTDKEGTHTIRRAVALAYYKERAAQGSKEPLRDTMVLLHHTSEQTTERYLGLSAQIDVRNEHLRNHGIVLGNVSRDNVVPLRPAAGGQ